MQRVKTVALKLTSQEMVELRRSRSVCYNCGAVFFKEDEDHVVCEHCVQEAMHAEGFVTKENQNG